MCYRYFISLWDVSRKQAAVWFLNDLWMVFSFLGQQVMRQVEGKTQSRYFLQHKWDLVIRMWSGGCQSRDNTAQNFSSCLMQASEMWCSYVRVWGESGGWRVRGWRERRQLDQQAQLVTCCWVTRWEKEAAQDGRRVFIMCIMISCILYHVYLKVYICEEAGG